MNYTNEEKEILKRVVRDYDILEKEINKRIEKGYNLEQLYDYIRHLNSCNITNYQISDCNFDKYFDFNYCDMCLSIYYDNELGVYLGELIEVWNDKENYVINTFNNINEIKEVILK